jgi:predicted histidine transporter YuiF (NhaC family)
MENQSSSWPSAAVAISIVALLTAVLTAACIKYSATDALKIVASFSAVLGLLTGVFVSYFFTKSSVQTAQQTAATAQQTAATAQASAANNQVAASAVPALVARLSEADKAELAGQGQHLATLLGR